MRFLSGKVTLGEILGGILASGTVPYPRFQRLEVDAVNAGAVTVDNAGVTVVSADCGTVVTGDRVLALAQWVFTKGAIDGLVSARIEKQAGTATVEFLDGLAIAEQMLHNLSATTQARGTLATIVKVTAGGTLTLRVRGISAGSDSTAEAGLNSIYAWVLPGS